MLYRCRFTQALSRHIGSAAMQMYTVHSKEHAYSIRRAAPAWFDADERSEISVAPLWGCKEPIVLLWCSLAVMGCLGQIRLVQD